MQSVPIELIVDPPEGTLAHRNPPFTGIAEYSWGREQPFTVWVRGETIKFCKMEARARRSLLPEIEPPSRIESRRVGQPQSPPVDPVKQEPRIRPSEAVQEWFTRKNRRDDVITAADELSEHGAIEVPTAEIVVTGLLVEPTEPRFDEFVAAADKVLEKHPRAKRTAAIGGRQTDSSPMKRFVGKRKTPINRATILGSRQADEVKLTIADSVLMEPERPKSRMNWSQPVAIKTIADPELEAPQEGDHEPGRSKADESTGLKSEQYDQMRDRLDQVSTILDGMLAQPWVQVLVRLRLFGFARLHKARREVRLVAKDIDVWAKASENRASEPAAEESERYELIGTVTLRTAHDIYRANSGYVIESHIRSDPQRTRSQRVSTEAVATVLGLLTATPQDIASLAHAIRSMGTKEAGFLYNGGRELGFEVQRALIVSVAKGDTEAIATPRAFEYRLSK